ncbi:protein ABHD15 isoform X2 [Delphinapterus leucas]|uniref:Protein ABHD15 isoform X2 n=1 Tax=Delphinapterus leucas TaxID=9749 RepID=A0A7F8KEG1_DELLE|nr:protein ABHD15 isoform X2 [Delphinapterus leucas]
MPPWGAALALLLAALALLGLLAALLRRPGRRAVGARTLPGAQGQDHEEEVDGAGPADQFSDGREPLPGGCRLICKPSALAQCLLRALRRSTALEPGPRSWLSGPHLQTLCHFVLPVGPGSDLAREYLQLADDGLVALDWVVGPCARGRRVTNAGGLPAVLLVIPNAWGRLTRNVLGLCLLALERGYYPVIFHRRGHHGCPLVSPRLQPFGDPSDLKEAITYIRFRHPAAPLFAVSEGSGSALLLSYLGECGSSSYMTGAACISPVLCCREWFEAGLPWPYERGFLLHQKIALSSSFLSFLPSPFNFFLPGTPQPWRTQWTLENCSGAAPCESLKRPSSATPRASPSAGTPTGTTTTPSGMWMRQPYLCYASVAPMILCVGPQTTFCQLNSFTATPTSSSCSAAMEATVASCARSPCQPGATRSSWSTSGP